MGPSSSARIAFRAAARAAVTAVGEATLGEAQRLAPIKEGSLRASAELDVAETVGSVIATLSFNTVYAARQHEETEWHHPKGGQAHYLSEPFNRNASTLERALELELKRRL